MPITDIQIEYPTGYDSADTILGLPDNRMIFILNGGLSVSSTTLVVDAAGLYDLEDIDLPCLMLFEGGEIWYIEDGDVASPTTLSINFSQRAQMGTPVQIHTDDEEVYIYFSGKQHETLIDILINLEKFPIVQGLQGGTPTLVGEAYIDSNYDIYVSFNGTTFTKLSGADHSNLDDVPSGATTTVHGDQYMHGENTTFTDWHATQTGSRVGYHITGGDDHTHLVDASHVQRVAHGSVLPTAEKVGQIYLKDGQLYFVYNLVDGFAEFFGIPAGSILPYDPVDGCPTGWTAYSALNSDSYAIMETGGTGTASGSNTHTHTVSEIEEHHHTIAFDTCTSTSGGSHGHSVARTDGGAVTTCISAYRYTTNSSGPSGTHSHGGGTQDASTTSGLTSGSMVDSFVVDLESSEPPYATMLWCKKD